MQEPIYISSGSSPAEAKQASSVFTVTIGDARFEVRPSQGPASECSIVNPKNADRLPQARELVDYLSSILGYKNVVFVSDYVEKQAAKMKMALCAV